MEVEWLLGFPILPHGLHPFVDVERNGGYGGVPCANLPAAAVRCAQGRLQARQEHGAAEPDRGRSAAFNSSPRGGLLTDLDSSRPSGSWRRLC